MAISTRAHAFMVLCIGAVVLPAVVCQPQPAITADTNGITLRVPSGSNAYLRVDSAVASRLLSDDDVAGIVAQAVNSAVAQFTVELGKTNTKLEQTNKDLDQTNLKLDQANLLLTQTNTTVEALKLENAILRKNITKIGAFELCDPPATPINGNKKVPPLIVPGTSVFFGCDDGFDLVGSPQSVCLQNGTLGEAVPTCEKKQALGSQARPAASCKDIYLDSRVQGITNLESGPRWISMSGQVAQVFCDMNTSSSDGLSGWTLCGKYDSERPGERYLTDGFGRVPTGLDDMASLLQFTGDDRKWSSIDCRSLLPESRYMMHVGANDTALPWGGESKSAVRFTNVLADVKVAPKNFFDTILDDQGVCRTRTQGAIRTFNLSFDELKGDGMDGDGPKMGLNNGACLIGQGHHFCSFKRKGSRLSNAGGNSAGGPCSSSDHDTIYWAWDADDHGCNPYLRIGTGCTIKNSKGDPGTPSFRYNYMFIH